MLFSILALVLLMGLTGCDVENETAPDLQAPEITITYPGEWATICSQQLEVHLDVLDAHPIDSVMVYVDGQPIQTFTTTPYQLMLQKADYDDGQHTIYAQATDSHGNTGNSTLLNFFWMQEEQQSQISVEIVRPVLWEKFTSDQIPVQIISESLQPLSSIEVYVDGLLAYTFSEAPYETTLTIDTQGVHNIYARATDDLDFSQSSTLKQFEVVTADLQDPTGFIASPADWSDVTGIVNVRITATDNVAIDRVELFVDGDFYSQSAAAPYQFSLDSSNLTNENHTLYGMIYDTSGNSCVTQLITVRVNN